MNKSSNKILSKTAACGCCEGISAFTPVEINNRPGLKAIAYRTGIHDLFKKTMLAHLASSRLPALKKLTTREDDDFSIALLDAWATVSDVLTFYQERIANESYLRTAAERLSIQHLAKLTGYELSPGSAASAYLAFTVDEAAKTQNASLPIETLSVSYGMPAITNISKGVKVQSIPGPGEDAQIFETIEEIEARPEWNAIKPRIKLSQEISLDMNCIIIKGITSEIKQGDKILIVTGDKDNNLKLRDVIYVDKDIKNDITRIDFEKTASITKKETLSISAASKDNELFLKKVAISEDIVKRITNSAWRAEDLIALIKFQEWSVTDFIKNLEDQRDSSDLSKNKGAFIFKKQAAVFGYNAAKEIKYSGSGSNLTVQSSEWNIASDEDSNKIYLDNAYDEIIPQQYIAIFKPDKTAGIFKVNTANVHPRTAYGISGKTTEITLSDNKIWWSPPIFQVMYAKISSQAGKAKGSASYASSSSSKQFKIFDSFDVIRGTMVYAKSEQLDLAYKMDENIIDGKSITLDGCYLYLVTGQKIILTGERSDLKGVASSEVMEISEVLIEKGFTTLIFEKELEFKYIRNTVTINANVAPATHGETVSEILGSGDSRKTFQSFYLSHKPLTYISASTPSGIESTLEVRVNDILWKEVFSLYGHGHYEHIYIVRTEDNGKTLIQFGDGKTGARLPSGKENVHAKYRKGSGLEGLVKAGQLKLLMTRPYGVKDVINPLDADSADEPESLDNARMNSPLKVLTLDRIVSLRDYEDFARSFTGIAKALGTWTWDGQARGAFITAAGPKGAEITTKSKVYENLLTALKKSGDPSIPVMVKSYSKALFKLSANIKIDPDYIDEKVLNEVKTELIKHFSFEMRDFGQQVSLSEVMAVIQSVSGVVSVDVDTLERIDGKGSDGLKQPLIAEVPKAGAEGDALAAEMLLIDENSINLLIS
jgi:hypothetical protein